MAVCRPEWKAQEVRGRRTVRTSAFATVLCGLLTAILLAPIMPAHAGGQRALVDLEQQIARDHSTVRSLTPDHFEELLALGQQVVVLDVREEEEFRVSRLPGASRLDPDIGVAEFMRRYGHDLTGRTVLLYCSVGVRSSRLAARIDQAVRKAGGLGAYNLLGGIFSWHNTGRSLTAGADDPGAPTELVHGYDRRWSRYVDFDSHVKLGR